MLRREQPLERYQKVAQQEVKDRKDQMSRVVSGRKREVKVPTLEEMVARARAVIDSREAAEAAASAAGGDTPLEDVAMPGNDTFQPIDTIEDHMPAPNKRKAPKAGAKPRAANPKAPRRTAGAKAAANSRRSTVDPFPPPSAPSRAPSNAASAAADPMSDDDREDELADSIVAKIGGDARAVRNLDVARILDGKKLGRTLQGAPSRHMANLFMF